MARLPHGAKQLIKQVQELFPDATYETVGEPDGLGVYRTIKFDSEVSEVLDYAFDYILHDDERIEGFHRTEAGFLHVEFVSGIEADLRDEYLLHDAVILVANDGEDEDGSDSEPEPPQTANTKRGVRSDEPEPEPAPKKRRTRKAAEPKQD